MKNLRVIDEAGNKTDYETEFVPRIGERIMLEFRRGSEPLRQHYFRVKDVLYRLDKDLDIQVAILIAEEHNPELWPS